MTDPRIEAAARALCKDRGICPDDNEEFGRHFGKEHNWQAYVYMVSIALAAADAAAWRPIETALKDGTQILLFRPQSDISAQRITAGAWYEPAPVLSQMCPDICEDDMPEPHWETWDGGFLANNPQPTCWQPLPAPPGDEVKA